MCWSHLHKLQIWSWQSPSLQRLSVTCRTEAKRLCKAQRPAAIFTPLQLYLLTTVLIKSCSLALPNHLKFLIVPLLFHTFAPFHPLFLGFICPYHQSSQQKHPLLFPSSASVTPRESFPLPLVLHQPTIQSTGFHHGTPNLIFYLSASLLPSQAHVFLLKQSIGWADAQ